MIKNTIIEMFSMDAKKELYKALKDGKKVYGTKNRRGIPGNTYIVNNPYFELVINPDEKIMCYIDFEIITIENAIIEMGLTINELQEYISTMSQSEFIEAVESMLHMINNQYSGNDIYNYIKCLELDIPEITEQEETELKRAYITHDIPLMAHEFFARKKLNNEELERIEQILLYRCNFDIKAYKEEQEQAARDFIEACRGIEQNIYGKI
jgi:hypothetical protein